MSSSCAAAETANSTHEEWAQRELGGAGLGDPRLDERLVKIGGAFMAAPQASIPRASGGWAEAKATYRFLDNKNVEPEAIYARHRESILPRAKGEPVVLAIADTTMLDYTSHPETAGLGPLSDLVHHGMLFHPTLLLTPQRVPLGVIDAQTWVRDIDTFGSKNEKPQREPEDKESGKWLASLAAAEELQQDLGEATKVVSVFDREGDIYDVLATARLEGRMGQILVRAKSDRRLEQEEATEQEEQNKKLWEPPRIRACRCDGGHRGAAQERPEYSECRSLHPVREGDGARPSELPEVGGQWAGRGLRGLCTRRFAAEGKQAGQLDAVDHRLGRVRRRCVDDRSMVQRPVDDRDPIQGIEDRMHCRRATVGDCRPSEALPWRSMSSWLGGFCI